MDSLKVFEMDLVVTFTAVFVAGLAAVLGIWMERDVRKPPRYAWALSALILLATFVSLMQSYFDKTEQDNLKDDMARLLTTMDRLASESDDPALLELVKSELNAQSRTDPTMVERVAQRVSDEGRDPEEVLGKHLDAAEVEKVTRKGSIKAKETDKVNRPEAEPTPKRLGRDGDTKVETKEAAVAPPRPVPTEEEAKRAAAIAAAQAAAAQGRPGLPPGAAPPIVPVAASAPAPTEAARAPVPTPRAGVPTAAPRTPVKKPVAPRKPRGR